jgi:nucleoside-diphosphate-sugar epimerase
MSKTIVLTGPTGFLGKAFVSTIDFPADDLFCILRGGQAYRASEPDKVFGLGDLSFLVQDYEQLEFVHFATHYSQPPSDNKDMLNIVEACLTFPITVLETLARTPDRILNLSSYFQLLPVKFQGPYSLAKQAFQSYLETNYLKQTKSVYIFDTYGTGDIRGKVINSFVEDILLGRPIFIPENEIHLNLTHSTDIIAKLNVVREYKPEGKYTIFSENTLSLKEVIKIISAQIGKKAKVVSKGKRENFLQMIETKPNLIGDGRWEMSLNEGIKQLIDETEQRLKR